MNITAFGTSLTGSSGMNGDNFYISPDKSLFILADGASGAGKDGKVVMSSTCVEIAQHFDFTTSGLSPHDYVNTLFQKINQALIYISQKANVLCYGTLVIALIHDDQLWVTSYGDSPAFLKTRGEVIQVARNQKRYEDMIEDGFITREQYESYLSNMHERMWSAFDRFLPEVVPNYVIESYTLQDGDAFILCSDGLSDWLTPKKMFEKITESNLESRCKDLVSNAQKSALEKQNYYDDITLIVALIKSL